MYVVNNELPSFGRLILLWFLSSYSGNEPVPSWTCRGYAQLPPLQKTNKQTKQLCTCFCLRFWRQKGMCFIFFLCRSSMCDKAQHHSIITTNVRKNYVKISTSCSITLREIFFPSLLRVFIDQVFWDFLLKYAEYLKFSLWWGCFEYL